MKFRINVLFSPSSHLLLVLDPLLWYAHNKQYIFFRHQHFPTPIPSLSSLSPQSPISPTSHNSLPLTSLTSHQSLILPILPFSPYLFYLPPTSPSSLPPPSPYLFHLLFPLTLPLTRHSFSIDSSILWHKESLLQHAQQDNHRNEELCRIKNSSKNTHTQTCTVQGKICIIHTQMKHCHASSNAEHNWECIDDNHILSSYVIGWKQKLEVRMTLHSLHAKADSTQNQTSQMHCPSNMHECTYM